MIEQAFAAPKTTTSTTSGVTPPGKRRKKKTVNNPANFTKAKKAVGGIPTPGPEGDSDEDEDYEEMVYGGGRASSAAKGTGYAGGGTEDVSVNHVGDSLRAAKRTTGRRGRTNQG